MYEEQLSSLASSDSGAKAAYRRWRSLGALPFRIPFVGLLVLATCLVYSFERFWSGPFRWFPLALSFGYVVGALHLFYDIPRRQLGRVSRCFLGLGIVILLAPIALAFLK